MSSRTHFKPTRPYPTRPTSASIVPAFAPNAAPRQTNAWKQPQWSQWSPAITLPPRSQWSSASTLPPWSPATTLPHPNIPHTHPQQQQQWSSATTLPHPNITHQQQQQHPHQPPQQHHQQQQHPQHQQHSQHQQHQQLPPYVTHQPTHHQSHPRAHTRWGPPAASAATSAASMTPSGGFFHPDRQRTPAAQSSSADKREFGDSMGGNVVIEHCPPSPTYAATDETHAWERPHSPSFPEGAVPPPAHRGVVSSSASHCAHSGVGGGTAPSSSSSSSSYDASQRVMRDPANRDARDASHNVRAVLKQDKKDQLHREADEQRRHPTFRARKLLYEWDGGCGAGGVTHYAFDAGIHVLVGCDVSAKRVEEARAVYTKLAGRIRRNPQKECKRRARTTADRSMFVGFSHVDAFAVHTHAVASALAPYDIFSYFNTLHYAASSMEALRCQFAFWEQQLTPTGSVIIQTVDPDVLVQRIGEEWTRLHTTFSDDDRARFCSPVPLRIGNRFYSIEWPAHQSVQGIHTGQPYTFSFLASMEPTTEYVMLADDLLRLATEHGLVCTRKDNLLDSATPTFRSLTQDDRDTIQLYRTYVLRGAGAPL